MNKIVILGHRSSGYQKIEEVLYKKGMAHAIKSKINMLSPQEIVKILSKSHNIAYGSFVDEVKIFEFEEIQPIWNNLFADLMIGNINSKTWGWADPNILPFINYLKKIDNNILFVLAFQSPKYCFKDLTISNEIEFNNKLNEWYNYNKTILDFYLNNSERAILINCEKINLLANKITNGEGLVDFNGDIKKDLFFLGEKDLKIKNLSILDESIDLNDDFLLEKLIFSKLKVKQLYQDLQDLIGVSTLEKVNNEISEFDLWKKIEDQKIKIKEKDQEIKKIQEIIVEKEELLKIKIAENENYNDKFIDLKKNFWKVEGLSKWQEKKINELKLESLSKNEELKKLKEKNEEEKKLHNDNPILKNQNDNSKMEILGNLLNLQEELEKQYITTDSNNLEPQKNNIISASDRIKKQLPYRLGAVIIKDYKNPSKLVGLPISIAKIILEDNISKEYDDSLSGISNYDEREDIERVKNHLSYRIGSKILEQKKNFIDWIKLPIDLKKEINEFNKESKR